MKLCGLVIFTARGYEKAHDETMRLGEAVGRLSVRLEQAPLPPTPPERPRRHLWVVKDAA